MNAYKICIPIYTSIISTFIHTHTHHPHTSRFARELLVPVIQAGRVHPPRPQTLPPKAHVHETTPSSFPLYVVETCPFSRPALLPTSGARKTDPRAQDATLVATPPSLLFGSGPSGTRRAPSASKRLSSEERSFFIVVYFTKEIWIFIKVFV